MKKLTALLVFIIQSSLLLAQDKTAYDFTFNHMALSVTDLNRSATFYKDLFQLTEITNRSAIDGIRWLSMGEGKELHLISNVKEPIKLNKAIHLSLATDKIDEFEKRLKEKNIPYFDWPGKANTVNVRADGVKQIYFQDPDGYWIEVNNGYAGTGKR